jgi:hypothetical protein
MAGMKHFEHVGHCPLREDKSLGIQVDKLVVYAESMKYALELLGSSPSYLSVFHITF